MRMRGVIMKERIEKIKEWIKKNKKRTIGIAAAVVLLIGALGIGIAGVNGFGSNAAQPDKTITAAKDTSNQKKADKDSEKNTETDTETNKTKETEDQKDKDNADDADDSKESVSSDKEETSTKSSGSSSTSTSSSNTKSTSSNSSSSSASSSNSSSSSSSNSSKSTHTHNYNIPVYSSKQVYVVDQAAWTETVEEPVYETVERSICNGCGADITGNEGTHMKENMLAGNTACGGYHSEVKQVQTGTTTRTINHPEEGHYETESYISGYNCCCGASM